MEEDKTPLGSIVNMFHTNNLKNKLEDYVLCDGSLIDSKGLDSILVQSLKQYTSYDEIGKGKLRVPNLNGSLSKDSVDALRYFIKLRDYKPSSVNFILSSTDD